jgi:hypothetical protein
LSIRPVQAPPAEFNVGICVGFGIARPDDDNTRTHSPAHDGDPDKAQPFPIGRDHAGAHALRLRRACRGFAGTFHRKSS